jgi:hypothetical protein
MELDIILNRLDSMERYLASLIQAHQAPQQCEWLDSKEFCRLMSLKDTKALMYEVSKGVIHGDAIRNIGTIKRPRYRFHRVRAADQFINRSSRPLTANRFPR